MGNSDLSTQAGTPVKVELCGTEYELSPHTLGDQGILDRFIEQYPINRAKRIAADMAEVGSPPEAIAKVWADATNPDTCAALLPSAMTCSEATVLQLYLSLKHKHPGITTEQVATLLTVDVQEAVDLALNVVNGVTDWEGNQRTPTRLAALLKLTGQSSMSD